MMARPHGRRPVLVRDLPMCGRPTLLVWSKRIWRCMEPLSLQRTWSEQHSQIRSRAALTVGAQIWAMRRVGPHGETVVSAARQLAVGWHTVIRAVREFGEPLVDDSARIDGGSRCRTGWECAVSPIEHITAGNVAAASNNEIVHAA